MANKRQRRAREIQREKGISYMAALREADADWAAQRAANVADQGIVIEELHEIKASPEADALGKSVSRASRSLGADRPNGSEP